ncbi:TcaA NTF2-like domain-containing protein [Bacillus alkalicellulosilyticus]|uniref:TcaA NTF2-like domain-containing protein n=1 Tax=Alkalihalobacterium alkalicellulosilyticum TaxID=1912214 RepID=UPI000996BBE1|nr:hypothetical protein [Bacillus alkalicellulosilyticus]
MKIKNWAIVFLLSTLVLTGCGDDIGELSDVSEQEVEDVSLFIKEYKEQLVDAVNGGRFNDVEPYLVANTTFYHLVRRYVSDLQNNKRLTLVEQTVLDVKINEHNEYYAHVNEIEETEDKFGQIETIPLDISYVLLPYQDSYRIVTIIKNEQ